MVLLIVIAALRGLHEKPQLAEGVRETVSHIEAGHDIRDNMFRGWCWQ